MKYPRILGLSLFLIGILVGHQFFPKEIPASSSTTAPVRTSNRSSPAKERLPLTPVADGTTIQNTNASGLLGLVDPNDPFHTANRFRDALSPLTAGDLEERLNDLTTHHQKDPKFYTTRLALINHLIEKDPYRAFDYLSTHDDPNFQRSSISYVIRAIARRDPAAAQSLINEIQEDSLRNSALTALMNVAVDSSPELLRELLAETGHQSGSINTPYFSNYIPSMMNWGGDLSPYIFHPNPTPAPNAVLSKLAQKDLHTAEEYARGLKTQQERNNALGLIASGLAQKDPDSALAWARTLSSAEGRDRHITTVLQSMATTNPQQVASMLDEISNLNQRNSLISTIAYQWVQKDQTASLAWLDSLPGSAAKNQAYAQAIHHIASEDPQAAVGLLDKLPGTIRVQALPSLISNWARTDFEGARQWITATDDPVLLNASLQNILSVWGTKDPQSAAEFLSNSSNRSNHFSQLAGQWSQKDPQAALTWAQEVENPDIRQSTLSAVYRNWASKDPQAVVAHLSSQSDPDQRNSIIRAIASNWTNQDPEASISWISTLPAEEHHLAANSAISSLSYSHPQKAAQLYDQALANSAGNDKQISRLSHNARNIVQYWSQYAPQEAALWAQDLPEKQREGAFANIASTWARNDPVATAEWVNTLPPGEPRNRATSNLIDHVKQIDPESAFEWAGSITDDQSRYNSISRVISDWKNIDPEAAREAIETADITESQRTNLINRLQ